MKGEKKVSINSVYAEIKKTRPLPAIRTCNICDKTAMVNEFLEGRNRCKSCHNQLSSGGITVDEFKEMLRAEKEKQVIIERDPVEISKQAIKSIIPELKQVLIEFHAKINKFTLTSDLKYAEGEDREIILEWIKKCQADSIRMEKILNGNAPRLTLFGFEEESTND
jgi:hypothetical protein